MATSSLDICNTALILCGSSPITSLSENTKEARLCVHEYDKVRKELLYAHPWNFAIGRIQIAADADLPANWEDNPTWDNAFTLGNDVLRVLELDSEDEEWAQESGKIFANYAPIFIKYIIDVTDVSKFPPGFESALAHSLAKRMVYALTQSTQKEEEIKGALEIVLRNARSFDAQEQSVTVPTTNTFTNARY